MNTPVSSAETLISALHALAVDIQSEDGVANAAIAEAAERLETYHAALLEIRDSKYCSYENAQSSSYGNGVVDGHRYCAIIARRAIDPNDERLKDV